MKRTTPTKILLAAVGIALGSGSASCALYSDSGSPGTTSQCSSNELTAVTAASKLQCPCGGVVTAKGFDTNCDETLESTEVATTNIVCSNVIPANCSDPSMLVTSVVLPIGDAHCPYGGTEFESGIDSNQDGILEASEITGHDFVCNLACTVTELTTTTTLPMGDEHCPCGGVDIASGIDNGDGDGVACDGVLQAGEVTANSFSCIDPPETPGGMLCSGIGPEQLVAEYPLPVGDAHCPYGGTEFEVGLDNGANGGIANDYILQPGEVQSTSYQCSPAPIDGGQPIVVDAGVPPADA